MGGTDGDRPTRWGVAQGVGEQIAQHLPHPLPVHLQDPGLIVDVHVEGHALDRVGLPVGLGGGVQQFEHGLFCAVQVDAPLLGAGDIGGLFLPEVGVGESAADEQHA